MSIVADYSAGFPGAAALKRAGFIGAVRYIGSPGNPKCTTAAELKDFLANGLGMSLVFEQTAGQWRRGHGQGQRDAIAGRSHASEVGYPLDRPIYFAIDQDVVTADEFEAMDAYADGWASVITHDLCGPYGEYDVVARCWNRGFEWAWQCRAWSGVPAARMFPERHLFQDVGTVFAGTVPCDVNYVNKQDWGQHPAPTRKERKNMRVVQSPSGIYVVGPEGKMHLTADAQVELYMKVCEQKDSIQVPEDQVASLPDSARLPVTMTEPDRAAIAAQVRLGLLEDLAPLLDLARRLES